MDRLGIIGSGKMAEALVKGVLNAGVYKKKEITVSDIDPEKTQNIKKKYGINTTADNKDLAESCNVIIFAVKPGHIEEVLNEIKNITSRKKLYISIAAGIKTSFIQKTVNKELKITRIMPNMPAVLQEGAFGIYFNNLNTSKDRESITKIFHNLGVVEVVQDEKLIDAVTGLSGSGPAFAAVFAEALADGGVKMGLSRETALKLSAQTILGTAKLILESGMNPSDIKDMVSSPGGTTIAGIHELEKHGLRNAVISAVESATLKSIELSSEEK